jgi:hypothetical protein
VVSHELPLFLSNGQQPEQPSQLGRVGLQVRGDLRLAG